MTVVISVSRSNLLMHKRLWKKLKCITDVIQHPFLSKILCKQNDGVGLPHPLVSNGIKMYNLIHVHAVSCNLHFVLMNMKQK